MDSMSKVRLFYESFGHLTSGPPAKRSKSADYRNSSRCSARLPQNHSTEHRSVHRPNTRKEIVVSAKLNSSRSSERRSQIHRTEHRNTQKSTT
ncbi:unnamed protein product [Bursaphelenchus okinawaensis]|uniref:Uncharacterized protein n=1 Tax=Bursaphelenchus okinawaensis TaxID=465554 RepID=A0A811L9I0_9BILA|nr:unnamed protein product [Bursaphelenchus okinawaensis]CAG9118869.1 unnamed protein product [Bursaphelenchus okinawaensis]